MYMYDIYYSLFVRQSDRTCGAEIEIISNMGHLWATNSQRATCGPKGPHLATLYEDTPSCE